uniref:Uncharacterized protein n=1 Tax=Triticum urartu TaxID=4572 RepID=A0A8R7U462_TRIUA
MYLKVLMMVLLYIAFNHIGLTKGFYLVEVVLVHLPLIKLWEALMNEVIDLVFLYPVIIICTSVMFYRFGWIIVH